MLVIDRASDIEFPKALHRSLKALMGLHEENDVAIRVRAEEAMTVIVKVAHPKPCIQMRFLIHHVPTGKHASTARASGCLLL